MTSYKMFGIIKKVFIAAVTSFNLDLLSVSSLECVSMNNQECKARPKMIDINNNGPVFYPYSIKGINTAEIIIISMIPMLNCAFLTL